MESSLDSQSRVRGRSPRAAVRRGAAWGAIAGLAATAVMDLGLMAAFIAAGKPAFTCFSAVGDTLAGLFSLLGAELAGGALPGAAAHYLVGPLFGIIFGAAAAQSAVLQACSPKKFVFFAILYVEIVSQPLFAMMPILLKMQAAETLLWFGGSVMMHLIWGVVMALVLYRGLRLTASGDLHPAKS